MTFLRSKSLTSMYLNGLKSIKLPKKRNASEKKITIHGARENNLKNITVNFPK